MTLLYQSTWAKYMADWKEEAQNPRGVNAKAHERTHGPNQIFWTSATTLAVGAGSPMYYPRGGQIVSITAGIKTAGSTTTSFNLTLDGVTATDSTIDFLANAVQSKSRLVKRRNFNEATKWQFTITAVGTSAAGPIVAVIEILPDL